MPDWWLGLIALCTGILALLAAIKGVAMLFRAIWRTIDRFNEVADDLLGDKAKGIPSMKERVALLEQAKHTHPEPQPKNAVRPRGRM